MLASNKLTVMSVSKDNPRITSFTASSNSSNSFMTISVSRESTTVNIYLGHSHVFINFSVSVGITTFLPWKAQYTKPGKISLLKKYESSYTTEYKSNIYTNYGTKLNNSRLLSIHRYSTCWCTFKPHLPKASSTSPLLCVKPLTLPLQDNGISSSAGKACICMLEYIYIQVVDALK